MPARRSRVLNKDGIWLMAELKRVDVHADRLIMGNTLPLEIERIDWPAIRATLKPGTKIDVQFNRFDAPVAYVVVMALDMPVFFCRRLEADVVGEHEVSESPMVYIPTTRDLCSLKVVVKESVLGAEYLALMPAENARFLRRRRSIRIRTWENINYRVQFDGKSNIYKGVAVEDLGRGGIGLLVYAAGPVETGASAQIKIDLPGVSEQLAASGEVTHCIAQEQMPRMYRVGIKFASISPRDQQTIAMYMERLRLKDKSK
jgi:hypothetical protein